MSVMLGRIAEVNPSVPEFDEIADSESVTFMPLETCWPDGRANTSRRAKKADVIAGYTRFRNGDVILPKITPTFEAGRVFAASIGTRAGAATTEVHVLRALPGADARFIAYFCRSQPFLQEGTKVLQGVGNLRRVSAEWVRSFRVPDLSLGEQRAIADYLDRETAQIDTLIAKQEQLIATLRERYKAEVALRAVGGFDPFDRSVDSATVGVNYSVTLGKMLDASMSSGAGDTELPYIRAANVRAGGLDLSSVNRMPFSVAEASRLDLRSGDLLVVEGGATVGTSVVLDADMPDWAYQKTVNRVRSLGIASTRWLHYVLQTYRDSGVIDVICDGSTFAHLTAEKLRALRVPETPPAEQARVAADLDERASATDKLVAKAERFIELAKERRSALITAAVTGQLDVRAA